MSGTGPELGGSFALGPWRVHRAGYGAMQLAGVDIVVDSGMKVR
jgi:hypothetical protein